AEELPLHGDGGLCSLWGGGPPRRQRGAGGLRGLRQAYGQLHLYEGRPRHPPRVVVENRIHASRHLRPVDRRSPARGRRRPGL
ncbi:MAG: hypothetical protein AVDCRST_MAG10-767, partial [uncultured Acidimicrobiales bacterium]